MDNWVGGVVGETYCKIQIVSCSSVKLQLIIQLMKLENSTKYPELGGIQGSRTPLTLLQIHL